MEVKVKVWIEDENKNLIEIIKPIVHEIMDTIKDSGYKMDFYDKDLYLLVDDIFDSAVR